MRVIKDSFLLQGLLTRQKSHGMEGGTTKNSRRFGDPLGHQIGLGIIFHAPFSLPLQVPKEPMSTTKSGLHLDLPRVELKTLFELKRSSRVHFWSWFNFF